MLSEKGLLIIEKLAEHNNELVTSKALAASTGMSERSVKTYLKEVADFCEQRFWMWQEGDRQQYRRRSDRTTYRIFC